MEIIIGLTIFLFLVTLTYWAIRGQIAKGRDAKRKDDLERIRVAFEDYFNDHGCYPDIEALSNCGGNNLAPYLEKIPCDPETGEPYIGIAGKFTLADCNNWYKVYASLENEDDPAIAKLGLTGGRTIDGKPVNYGVSSPNVAVGSVPPTTFICPSTGEPAKIFIDPNDPRSCSNPNSYVGDCEKCGCPKGYKIVEDEERSLYYCCESSDCPREE